jgi:transposase
MNMIEKIFSILSVYVALTSCALASSRYSTRMSNIEALTIELNKSREENAALIALNQSLSNEQMKLKQQVQELSEYIKKLMEGNRREKFINPDQKLLEFPEDKELQASLEAAQREAEQELETIILQRTKRKKVAKPKSDSFPAHIPRRENEDIPLSAEDQARAADGHKVVRKLVRETLHFEPSKLFVEVQYQQMLEETAESSECKKIIAQSSLALPAHLGEEGRYAASIGACIVYNKFGLHIPYYRMQDIFAGSGLTISRSTLDYIPNLVYEAIEPVLKLMIDRLLQSKYVGMDDTNVTLIMPRGMPDHVEGDSRTQRLIEKMLEAKRASKPSLQAKMWAYSGGPDQPYDLFDFRVSRHRDGPSEFLGGYAGHVMADCYSGNLSVILDGQSKMVRLACWAHARRKLFEAKDVDTKASALPLALIGQLYDIERKAVDKSDEERTQIRQKESRVVLDRLNAWLNGNIAKNLLPSTKLATAVQYIRNHWDALCEYTTDGALPIDNNWVERLMKRIACGRKNWLFVGSVRAGVRNAGLISLVSSAHRHDLDVQVYLESVIRHMVRGTATPEELLPDVWKKSHPAAIRKYREEERRDKAELAQIRSLERKAGKG